MDSIAAILCAWRLNPCTRALASSVQRSRNGNHGPRSGEELLETPRAALWDWAGEAGNARRREQIRQRYAPVTMLSHLWAVWGREARVWKGEYYHCVRSSRGLDREQMRTVAVELHSNGPLTGLSADAQEKQNTGRQGTEGMEGSEGRRGGEEEETLKEAPTTKGWLAAISADCEACNCWAVPPCGKRLALYSAYTARPMGVARRLEKATGRHHWAATPCRALARIGGCLHRLGCWDAASLGVRAGEGVCGHVEFDVLLLQN